MSHKVVEEWNNLATFVLDVSYALPSLLDEREATRVLSASRSWSMPTKFTRSLVSRKLAACKNFGVSYKAWEEASQALLDFLSAVEDSVPEE
jgi:hypothetical protein